MLPVEISFPRVIIAIPACLAPSCGQDVKKKKTAKMAKGGKRREECSPCWCWTCVIFWILVIILTIVGIFAIKAKLAPSKVDVEEDEQVRSSAEGLVINTRL